MSSYQIPPHVKLQSYANVTTISGRTAAAIIPVADKNQSLESRGVLGSQDRPFHWCSASSRLHTLLFELLADWLPGCLDKRLLSTRSIEFMQKGCKFCDMWSRRWGKLYQFHGGVTINKSRRMRNNVGGVGETVLRTGSSCGRFHDVCDPARRDSAA